MSGTQASIACELRLLKLAKSATSFDVSTETLFPRPGPPQAVVKYDPEDPALGRSRGRFSTKIYLLCDAHGHPLHVHLNPGQAHESTAFKALLEGAYEQVVEHDEDPVAWPVQLAGNDGYPAEWIYQ